MTDSETKKTRGVSPVIGVILMVAVVVILAALIGVYAVALSDSTESNVNAGVETDTTEEGVQVRLNSSGTAEEVVVLVNGSEVSGAQLTDVGDSVTVTTGADDTVTIVGVGPDGNQTQLQTVTPEEDTTGGSGSPEVVSGGSTPGEEVTGTVSLNPNIEGATVLSYDSSGSQIDTATTDENGEYSINAVSGGRIVVNVTGETNYNGNPIYASASKTVSDTSSELTFNFDETASTSTTTTVDGQTVYVAYQTESTSTNQIGNVYQLQGIDQNLSASYELVRDIDASGTSSWNGGSGFEPIGGLNSQFTGSIDGQEHVIDGLYIARPSTDNIGLIGYAGSGSSISNIGVVNIDMPDALGVGGLVGTNRGSITDSYATGSLSGVSSGGLVGHNFGSIKDSYAEVSIDGDASSGGLVSENEGSITDSYATGNVTVDASRVGGLAGMNSGGSSITDSYATGSVNGDDQVGGLVGRNFGSITDSYATGSVTGSKYVGGLVGRETEAGGVTSSYATGSVTGSKYVGGFVGEMTSDDVSVTSSYATGSVTGSKYVGGFVGYNNYGVSVTSSYATGSVGEDSAEYVGGFVGYNDGGASVTSSYATGSVSGNFRIAGLAGENFGSISDSYWDIDSTGQSYGGGGGTGLTTSEMQGSGASSNMSNLDFGSVWTTTSGYPELQNNRE